LTRFVRIVPSAKLVVTFTVRLMFVLPPPVIFPRRKVEFDIFAGGEELMKVVPFGMVSVTVTLIAVASPRFVILIVKKICSPIPTVVVFAVLISVIFGGINTRMVILFTITQSVLIVSMTVELVTLQFVSVEFRINELFTFTLVRLLFSLTELMMKLFVMVVLMLVLFISMVLVMFELVMLELKRLELSRIFEVLMLL